LAEVFEQQKPVLDVGRVHARTVQAGRRDAPGDLDEGPHILLRWRRVHHHQAAVRRAVDAQVAAEARVGRSGTQAGRGEAETLDQRLEPLQEGGVACGVGPGHRPGGRAGQRKLLGGRCGCGHG
jgi:hypothetical protein